MKFNIETELEDGGRWIAEVTDLPGVMAYGKTKEEAIAYAEAIALRVIADQIDKSGEAKPDIKFACA